MKIFLTIMIILLMQSEILPQYRYYNHSYFDHSITPFSYFMSAGFAEGDSELELVDGKIPIDENIFFFPPNALKLHFTSAPGGYWEASVQNAFWRGREGTQSGNLLSFYLFTEERISADKLPRIRIETVESVYTDFVSLSTFLKDVPVKKWVKVEIPLSSFMLDEGSVESLGSIASIRFSQNSSDAGEHTIFVDQIKITDPSKPASPLLVPENIAAAGYELHNEISWRYPFDTPAQGFLIYRSWDGKTFSPIGFQSGEVFRYVDFLNETNKTAYYRIASVNYADQISELSPVVSASTRPFSDDELLTMVQESHFRYYWEAAHPVCGLALENIPGMQNMIATGASGFGICAIITGAERDFITREQAAERLLTITRFLEKADRFHGAFPHFLDGTTGKVIPFFGKYDNGGDLVETSFLMQGLLAARAYFSRNNSVETEIRSGITRIWESVEWDWYLKEPGGEMLFWHWSPDYEWHINHPLVGFNETMITYLLAIASPTHPIPPSVYYTGWAQQTELGKNYRENWGQTTDGNMYANGNEYYGVKLDVGVGSGGPLFFTHYSFLCFDPRAFADRFTNYFDNNKNIALINRAYCIENPKGYIGYGEECWGLTASDDPWGYTAHEPDISIDNGTITPTGALSSFPYTPEYSMDALKYFYRKRGKLMYDVYGFRDAMNETQNWTANIVMGLNQAPITVMIENYRSGFLWNLFMKIPEIQTMVNKLNSIR